MTTETICLDALEEVAPDEKVPLDVYVRLPPDANGARYLRRKRWRTFGEVFKDMHDALYVRVCKGCGHEAKDGHKEWNKPCKKCGGEMEPLIDEYDSGPARIREFMATRQIADADEFVVEIVCHSHVGGNEGYYATMGVLLRRNNHEGLRYVQLYWVKSFRGMQHVHNLVERMMKATGAWPVYGKYGISRSPQAPQCWFCRQQGSFRFWFFTHSLGDCSMPTLTSQHTFTAAGYEHLPYEACEARWPRLVRLMQDVAILSRSEAACGIRDYRDGRAAVCGIHPYGYQSQWELDSLVSWGEMLIRHGGGEAVQHYGGPRRCIANAISWRRQIVQSLKARAKRMNLPHWWSRG